MLYVVCALWVVEESLLSIGFSVVTSKYYVQCQVYSNVLCDLLHFSTARLFCTLKFIEYALCRSGRS